MSTEAEPAADLQSLADLPGIFVQDEPELSPAPVAAEPTPANAPLPEPEAEVTPAPETARQRQLIDILTERHPDAKSFLDPYADDMAALDGLVHAKRLVGRRDEDAEIGKLVRASGREQDIAALLRGQYQPPQSAPAPNGKPADPGLTPEEANRWIDAIELDPETKQYRIPPGAPPDIVQKLAEVNRRTRDTMLRLSLAPEEFLAPFVQRQAEMVALQFQQQQVQQQAAQSEVQHEANVLMQFTQQNPWAFVNGDPNQGYTPLGMEVCQTFDSQPANLRPSERLAITKQIIQARYANRQPVAVPDPPRHATHAPAVAASPPVDRDTIYKERLEKLSLSEHLKADWLDRQRAGATAQ
jgi:hypothetical protein